MQGSQPALASADDSEFMTSYGGRGGLRSVSAISVESLQEKRLDSALGALWFDDTGDKPAPEFQEEWQEFLRSYNLFQFITRFACFTREMMEQGGISNLIEWLLYPEKEDTESAISEEGLSEEQVEELELLHPDLQPLLVPLLKESAMPWPEFGYEATTSSGQCGTAMLEVAWPDRKVGIALPQDEVAQFEIEGWTLFSSENLDPDTLVKALST